MRRAMIAMHGTPAGVLTETERGRAYHFAYLTGYAGEPVSLTMPVSGGEFRFDGFPPFFDGLLPEGIMLEGLLRERKIDRDDCLSQLLAVGGDMTGAVTAGELIDEALPHNL